MNKQKKQIAVLVALTVATAVIWSHNRQQDPASKKVISIPPGQTGSDTSDLEIRWSKIEASRGSDYQGKRNIFSDNLPSTAVLENELRRHEPIASVVPMAPELPMKFFGYGTVPNGTPRRAYLSDGDDVYIVSEGDTLLGRYRILRIGNSALEFEEILSRRHGIKTFEDVASGS